MIENFFRIHLFLESMSRSPRIQSMTYYVLSFLTVIILFLPASRKCFMALAGFWKAYFMRWQGKVELRSCSNKLNGVPWETRLSVTSVEKHCYLVPLQLLCLETRRQRPRKDLLSSVGSAHVLFTSFLSEGAKESIGTRMCSIFSVQLVVWFY